MGTAGGLVRLDKPEDSQWRWEIALLSLLQLRQNKLKQNPSVKYALPKHYIRNNLIWEPTFIFNSGLWLRGVGPARAEAVM